MSIVNLELFGNRIQVLEDTRPQEKFKSVAVIGAAGQVGELFTRTFAERLDPDVSITAVVRNKHLKDEGSLPVGFYTDIGQMLATEPEMVVLATPNPTDGVLKEIALYSKKPLTLVFPQNGVDVVPTAEKILAESPNQVRLVRASLFTNVSRDSTGELSYNKDKNRIALASVGEDPDYSVPKIAELFKNAGFDVKVVSDYKAMEWAKLIGNLFGSTSAITGLPPFRTFADRRLFAIEHQALKDRFEILDKAGIRLDDLWGIGQLRLLSKVPGWIGRYRGVGNVFRGFVVKKISAERNNQPSAAARQISEGATRVEVTDYYHRPIIKLGEEHNIESPVDWTVFDILKRQGLPERTDNFSLNSLSAAEKRRLLFEIYDLEKEKVFVKSNPVLRFFLRNLLKGLYHIYLKSSQVLGKEHLTGTSETLKSGKSVLVAPMHVSNSDHQAIEEGLAGNLPPEALRFNRYIVANRKFDKERLSGFFSRAFPHPVVWTTSNEDSEDVFWRARIFNRRAFKKIEELLDEPCIMIVYLEGGRNKKPGLPLQPPSRHSSLWVLNSKIGKIVPAVILGTEQMLPPGTNRPKRADIIVEFLKVGDVAELRSRKREAPKGGLDKYLVGRNILKSIADKLPESRRGGY